MGEIERFSARPSPTNSLYKPSRRNQTIDNPTNMFEDNIMDLLPAEYSINDFINSTKRMNSEFQDQDPKAKLEEEIERVMDELADYYSEFKEYYISLEKYDPELRRKIEDTLKCVQGPKQEIEIFKLRLLEGDEGEVEVEKEREMIFGIEIPVKDHEEFVKTFEGLLAIVDEMNMSREEFKAFNNMDWDEVFKLRAKRRDKLEAVIKGTKKKMAQVKGLQKTLKYLSDRPSSTSSNTLNSSGQDQTKCSNMTMRDEFNFTMNNTTIYSSNPSSGPTPQKF